MNPGFIVIPIWLMGCVAVVVAISIGIYINLKYKMARTPVPGWNFRVKDCPYRVEDVARAVAAFVDAWALAFGRPEADKLEAFFNQKSALGLGRFSIHFRLAKIERSYDLQAGSRTLKVAGHMASDRSVVVAHLAEDFLGTLALFHELTHPSLKFLYGAPDNNHAEPPGPWKQKHDEMVRSLKADFNKVKPFLFLDENYEELTIPPLDAICGTCKRFQRS